MTGYKAPGKAHRDGLTFFEVADMFSTEERARKWFESKRWPDGPFCPHCGTFSVQSNIKHKTMTHRCRDCPKKPMFSLKTGTIMHGTKLGYRVWAIAVYALTTNLKGVSSMRMHRELGITQKSAWHLLHRLRKAYGHNDAELFEGPAEADETFVGGKRKNMPKAKREKLEGRGTTGKQAVVGIKDRKTKKVVTQVIPDTTAETLQGFVREHVRPGATLYTDEAVAYRKMHEFAHDSVKHSVGEYVKGRVHTNGIESLWSMLKRGYVGTYHKMSHKHLHRSVAAFSGRHNQRELDTLDQMHELVMGMEHKRLRYRDLIADNGLPSGAREE